MPTLFALDTRFHSDIAPFPEQTTAVSPVFGGLGTFCYGHHPPEAHSTVTTTDGPYRDRVQVLEARPGANVGLVNVPISPFRHYRMSVWVRRSTPRGRGICTFAQHNRTHNHHDPASADTVMHSPMVQFGVGDANVRTLSGQTSPQGGWFTPESYRMPPDRWTLLVGYLHGHQSCRSAASGAAYDGVSLQPVTNLTDYKQDPPNPEPLVQASLHYPSTTTQTPQSGRTLSVRFVVNSLHSLQQKQAAANHNTRKTEAGTKLDQDHGDVSGEVMQFFLPRVDEVDGSEAGVEELLRGYAYTLLAKPFVRTLKYAHTTTTTSPSQERVRRRWNQLSVALDKLCEIDRRLEQVVTIDNITEKIRVVQIGDVAASPDTVVRRDSDGGIEANAAKLSVVEVDVLVTTSDRRLKTDIEPDSLGLEFVRMLEPVRYRRRRSVDAFSSDGATQQPHGSLRSAHSPVRFCANRSNRSPNLRPFHRRRRFRGSTLCYSKPHHRFRPGGGIHDHHMTRNIWEDGEPQTACPEFQSSGEDRGAPSLPEHAEKCITPPSSPSPPSPPSPPRAPEDSSPRPLPAHPSPATATMTTTPNHQPYETGLIAQDVQAALQHLGRDWSGHQVATDGTQGIQYAMLTVPLVRAVQELADQQDVIRDMLHTTVDVVRRVLTAQEGTTFPQEIHPEERTGMQGTGDEQECSLAVNTWGMKRTSTQR
jgi:hypothetical protein